MLHCVARGLRLAVVSYVVQRNRRAAGNAVAFLRVGRHAVKLVAGVSILRQAAFLDYDGRSCLVDPGCAVVGLGIIGLLNTVHYVLHCVARRLRLSFILFPATGDGDILVGHGELAVGDGCLFAGPAGEGVAGQGGSAGYVNGIAIFALTAVGKLGCARGNGTLVAIGDGEGTLLPDGVEIVVVLPLDDHLTGYKAAAVSGQGPAGEGAAGFFRQSGIRVAYGGNFLIDHVGTVCEGLVLGEIGMIDNVGSGGRVFVHGRQRDFALFIDNIGGDGNGGVGLVNMIVAAQPVGEHLAIFIIRIGRLHDLGRASVLIGLGVHHSISFAVFHINYLESVAGAGEDGYQHHRGIQLGVLVEQLAAGIAPRDGHRSAVGSRNGAHHIAVAGSLGKGVAIGDSEGLLLAVYLHGIVHGCLNRLCLPYRISGQASGGHGLREHEFLGALRVGKPSGELMAGRCARRRFRGRQFVHRLLILISINTDLFTIAV